MQKSILAALVVALFSGLAVGVQSSFINVAGKNTGAILTGLLVNIFAGIAAGLLVVIVYVQQGNSALSRLQAQTWGVMLVAGLLGIGVIAGIAYSLPKTGVAAGLSMIITGQMIVGVLVDMFGLTGGEPIPLTWMRIGGLGLLALGTWAIVPK